MIGGPLFGIKTTAVKETNPNNDKLAIRFIDQPCSHAAGHLLQGIKLEPIPSHYNAEPCGKTLRYTSTHGPR